MKWTCKTAYLVVCSSGGVPAASALGSEVVLSTGAPADAVGEVAAAGGQTEGGQIFTCCSSCRSGVTVPDISNSYPRTGSAPPTDPRARTFVSGGAGPSTALLSLQVFLVADRTHAVGAGVTVKTASHSTKHWHLRLVGLLSHALARGGGWGVGGVSRGSLKMKFGAGH